MVSAVISRLVIIIFGTLYPAYGSYKAIRTKNVKEYVKWMMYWVVFALFTFIETFADIFLAWVPFYYEIKIVFVVWLLSPATRGSSLLYRKFVHPRFMKHENEIDEYIAKVGDQGYSAILNLGQKGISYASKVVAQAAIKGHSTVMDHLQKSYSMGDLSNREDDDKPVSYRPMRSSTMGDGTDAIPELSEDEKADDDLDLDNRLVEERDRRNKEYQYRKSGFDANDNEDGMRRKQPQRVTRAKSGVGELAKNYSHHQQPYGAVKLRKT